MAEVILTLILAFFGAILDFLSGIGIIILSSKLKSTVRESQ